VVHVPSLVVEVVRQPVHSGDDGGNTGQIL
jgi:hypothetical protein